MEGLIDASEEELDLTKPCKVEWFEEQKLSVIDIVAGHSTAIITTKSRVD